MRDYTARDGRRVRTLPLGDPDYPVALLDLRDPPAVLHVLGAGVPPARARAVAIVGSRAASPYGRSMAIAIASDLAAMGYVVVSGLARGIDAAAHTGALEAGGVTHAILPSAVDHVTPAEHEALARRITEQGALVSEVASGGPFGPGAFVKRNRLIAALAGVVVVVEAGQKSGALRTAEVAGCLGRPLLAVPGDVDRPTARGTLALLRAGARPCADAGDVLQAMAVAVAVAGAPAASPDALPPGDGLAAALTESPQPLETLARAAGLQPGDAAAQLLRLEWAGVATAHPGGRWSRRQARA